MYNFSTYGISGGNSASTSSATATPTDNYGYVVSDKLTTIC